MSKRTPTYYSYLLRLRLVDNAGQPVWRITLQVPASQTELPFASLAALCAYLTEQVGLDKGDKPFNEEKGEP